MAINISHFDTKLQTLTGTEEKIKNSLAEYLFPDVEFALTNIYENSTTPEELQFFEDKTAQFSNGRKVYFASDEVREKVYPLKSDGAAYGSLVFTPCKDFKELKNLRILVVDDETGANGGVIPNSLAKSLVGDCYGRMSPALALQLTGTANTPFQFRMGIKPQEGNDVHRIAKGTLAPSELMTSLGEPQITQSAEGRNRIKAGYDLVIARSSFKGRKDESKIKPGEYNLTVGVGIKILARQSKQSLGTQILVNYPKGVEADILPLIETAAQRLADIQSDPRKVAQYFVDKHSLQRNELHQDLLGSEREPESELGDFEQILGLVEDDEFNLDDYAPDTQNSDYNQEFYYLLEACAQTHPTLLEHPNIVNKLSTLIRKEWLDIATGRAIEFQSGLAQPARELLLHEVCVPHIPEGEKLIVTRSPLINSNGVITLTNKHLKEFAHEQGTIHIHPETALSYLQADFDGDRLAYELASLYPTLTAEIEAFHLPENRHTDVIKAEKQPYEAETFGEIALTASGNKIGIIANNIQKAVAIENEIDKLPEEEKLSLLFRLKGQCIQISNLDINSLDIPEAKKQQCLSIQEKAKILADFATPGISETSPTPENINKNLLMAKLVFFETVDVLSNELQTAADGPKSAARPNEDLLNFAHTILEAREVEWISDKKEENVYKERVMHSVNYSPVDQMIQATNQVWQDHHLESLPTHQFANFFPKDFTAEQEAIARQIVKNYNSLYADAVALKEQAKNEPGTQMIVTSATSNKQITITNLRKYNHPDAWKGENLDIKLTYNEQSNRLLASAKLKSDPSRELVLGLVSQQSEKEHNLRSGMTLSNAKTELVKGITEEEIRAKFREARNFASETLAQYPDSVQALKVQSAIWHVTHASNQLHYENYSKASAAFNIFPELVTQQAKEAQFKDITLAGIHHPTNEWGQQLNKKTINFAIALETRANHPNCGKRVLTVEGKQVAPISENEYHLPIGTKGTGMLVPNPSTSVTATTAKGNSIKIGQIGKYDFAGKDLSGIQTELVIGFIQPKGKANPVPVVKIGDKTLGVIDVSDRDKLKAAGLLKPGAKLTTTLQLNPPSTATLKIEKESLNYPDTWIRSADASKQQLLETISLAATRKENTSESHQPTDAQSPPLSSPHTSTPVYQRPEWEQKMAQSALRTLNSVQPDSFGRRVSTFGEYVAIYSEKEKALRILDGVGDRGILYKAQRGEAPSISNFSQAEKQQLACLNPAKEKVDALKRS
jgi:hypothetical protein